MKNSTQQIEKELMDLGSPLPQLLTGANPFTVPDGYFDGFADQVLQKIRLLAATNETVTKELSTLSPLLSTLKKENPFSVPGNYFSTFTVNIDSLSADAEAKDTGALVIPMKKTTSRKTLLRYLVAAAVVGFVGIALFFVTGDKKPRLSPGTENYAVSLPELPDDVLANYLEGLPEVNGNEFADSSETSFFDNALFKINDDKEIAAMLTNVPDNDLDSYDKDML